MPFPQDWADKLFAKLHVAYGEAFLAQWPAPLTVSKVQAAWADTLDGWERYPEAFRWALANLPEKPLNAIAFRNLLRQAPVMEAVPQLPPPVADPGLVAEIMKRATTRPQRVGNEAQVVARGIVDRLKAQTRMASRAQRDFMRTCQSKIPADDPVRDELRALGCDVEPTARGVAA